MKTREFFCIAATTLIYFSMLERTYSQTYPKFEQVEELVDWYKVCVDEIEKNYAVVGHATISGSSSPGFVVYDWFNVHLDQRSNPKKCFYSEVRRTYAGGEYADTWEKYLTRDEYVYYSMGNFSNPLGLVPKPKIGPDGKPIIEVSRHMVVPNLFMLAIVNHLAYTTRRLENSYILSDLEGLRQAEGEIENGVAKGFFINRNWGVELEFREEFGWMPTKVKGYFRDTSKKGVVDRTHFSQLQYEVQTEWEKLDGDKFVPKKLVNFVARTSSKSKQSQSMELSAVWVLRKTTPEMFSDESMTAERTNKGPLSEIKEELFGLENPKAKTKSK